MTNKQQNILFCIGHPAEVHVFRNAIEELESRDHNVMVICRQKEIVVELLDAYNIEYDLVTERGSGIFSLALETIRREIHTLLSAKKFDPDVIVSNVDIPPAHASVLLRVPYVVFNDVEENHLPTTYPIADRIYTPHFFDGELGDKHQRYNGYHELAYLHPDWFEPNPNKLEEVNVDPEDPYVVFRFVDLDAYHDRGQEGISNEMKIKMVSHFSKYADIYITSEGTIPKQIQEYEMKLPPHLFHDLLHYADLCIGDSQAIAAEASVLGTPTVRTNSFCEGDDITKFAELENEYGLLRSTPDEAEAFKIAKELFKNGNIIRELKNGRERMLDEKTDLTELIVDEVVDTTRGGQ